LRLPLIVRHVDHVVLVDVPASHLLELGAHPSLWTDTWRPNSTAILAEGDSSGGKMLDSVGKVERYRKEAIKCAELAKEVRPPFLAEIYRKVATLRVYGGGIAGPARNEDAFERADLMISRLRPDPS